MPGPSRRARSLQRSPRRLLAALGAVTLGSAAALGWLGWEIVRQDAVVEEQRERDRLELDADRVVQALERRLGDIDTELTRWLDSTPAAIGGDLQHGAGVVMTPAGVTPIPPTKLLFHSVLPAPPEISPAVFSEAEELEFRQSDLVRAADAYRRLSESGDPVTRAAALLGLSHTLRRAGRHAAALPVYADLEKLGDVTLPASGWPASLLASSETAVLLEELGRTDEARKRAAAVRADLDAGRWLLTRGQYEHFVQAASRFKGAEPTPANLLGEAIASATLGLWTAWRAQPSTNGSELKRSNGVPLLVRWRGTPNRASVWMVQPAKLVAALELDPAVAVSVSDAGGFIGAPPASRKSAVRTSADTTLPWTLHVSRSETVAATGSLTRRQLLAGGLIVMLVFLAAGTYFIGRTVKRETELARLQSDFVAVVSHEFRTPLAAMRQFSELLAAGRVPGDDKKQHYYDALAGESRRLQRLVENLLNFGRLEAGAKPYRLELVDPRALVDDVVSEYRSQIARPECRIEVAGDETGATVMADREAVSLALHNLVDNAVKYSGAGRPVRVQWTRQGDRIALSVRDEGPGIAVDEQQRIFQKFVRGAAAASGNVRGTGVGLAMVQLVAAGHGGEVIVRSAPGAGATFTMLLPAAIDRANGASGL